VEGVWEESEDVLGELAGAAVLGDFRFLRRGRPIAAAGTDADVGVAAEMLAASTDSRRNTRARQRRRGGRRRPGFEVGGEGAVERDEGVGTGEAQELGAFGMDRPHERTGIGDALGY